MFAKVICLATVVVMCITDHEELLLKSCVELVWVNSHQKEGENWVHPILWRKTRWVVSLR